MIIARPLRPSTIAWVAVALFGCENQPLAFTPRPAPVAEIVDGVHATGNAHFFFLPPLVSAPAYSGTSDGSQRPVVKVCEWSVSGTTCSIRIAEFSMTSGTASQVIRYDAKSQLYVVNWPSGQCVWGPCTLDPTKTYRLRVLIGVAELGHGDIKVVKSTSGLKDVSAGQYIGVIQGSTLAVKFRIERGAVLTSGAYVGTGGGTLTSADGGAGLIIPPKALSQNAAITVGPTAGSRDAGIVAGSVYDLGPSGTSFAAPVMLTIRYDPTQIPGGEDEASLKLYQNAGAGWERVAGSGASLTDHTVSGPITHFSGAAAGIPVARVDVSVKDGRPLSGYYIQLDAVTYSSSLDTLTDRVVTWASSDPSVATVDQTGRVSILGQAPAQTTITATSDGVIGSWVLVVQPTPVPVTSVSLSPASASVPIGQGVTLTATAWDADGNPLNRAINGWVSSDYSVAYIAGVGPIESPATAMVVCVGVGVATITATSGPDLPVNGAVSASSAITCTAVP